MQPKKFYGFLVFLASWMSTLDKKYTTLIFILIMIFFQITNNIFFCFSGQFAVVHRVIEKSTRKIINTQQH